ncbi:hypothetical protein Tco_1102055 [Tanacetum coccineum]
MTTARTRAVVNTGKDSGSFILKKGNPEILLQDHAVVDSGCSSHMTGNKAYLSDYEDYNGGFVAFGSDPKGVPTGRVKVPAGRYVVPTGKDNVIVNTGRSKVIPAGRTILVVVVLCLLLVDSIVSDKDMHEIS